MEEVGVDTGTVDIDTKLEKFLRAYYTKDILKVVEGYPETRSLVIDFNDLDKFDMSLADELIVNPDHVIAKAEKALKNIDLPLDQEVVRINIRFKNLPPTNKRMIRELRSEDVGKFITIEGVVRKSTDVRPKLVIGAFECQRCGSITHLDQDGQKIKQPFLCESCETRGPFKLIVPESVFVDSQKILIQESLEDLKGGEHPKQLTIFLEDDLTGEITPGDKIEVVGVLRAVRKRFREKLSRVFEIFLDANYYRPIELEFEELEITEEDEKEIKELSKDPLIYEKIRDSIAPHIYGYNDIKEAIMYQLFSSPALELPDGGRIRGDSHILIIGEPATGKSELLQYVARELAPRGVYASGKGATAGGLTAVAVKDEFGDGGWSLEAGALVLADGGIACLHPKSKVLVDSKIVDIESLFDKNNKYFALTNGEKVEISNLNAEIVSLNDELKVVSKKSTLIRRKKYKGKMLEITTKSGFKVKLTPDHKLLDGNSLKWKEARDFRISDFIISPLKLPGNDKELYLLDIIPDEWLVILNSKEKKEIKEKVLSNYKTLKEFNEKYGLNKDVLSWKNQTTVRTFKAILRELNCYDEWKKRNLSYGRKSAGERLKVSKITPELAYFLGFLYGDGHVKITKRRSSVSITQSIKNLRQIEQLKKTFEKFSNRKLHSYKRLSKSRIRGKNTESYNVILYSNSNLIAYLYNYLTKNDLKNILRLPDEALKAFIAGALDSDGCISIKKGRKSNKFYETVHVEFLLSNDDEKNKAFMLALRRLDCFGRLIKGRKIDRIRITGRTDVYKLVEEIKKYSTKVKELPSRKHHVSSLSEKVPQDIAAHICSELSNINNSILLKRGVLSTIYNYKNKTYQPSRRQLIKLRDKLPEFLSKEIENKIEMLVNKDYFLDTIVDIKEFDYDGYVYDLFVPEYHNFVCDGIIVHNCIDEFEKMDPNDRAGIHEAAEQQTVSIAKAGLLATFRARCSILAAANPKYGRFDEYRPISEQINLPPTILSRFDLIFFVRDVLDETRAIARHILDTASEPQKIAPRIKPELLKKYIAYARQNCFPSLTPEARERVEQFYVEMREAAREAEGVPIPLTARQLWAILRIARASSRVRLSDKTTVEDVNRAIRLVNVSLRQAGFDLETGKYDIDKIMVGVTRSQRERLTHVLDIIKELEKELNAPVKKSEIIERAVKEGIPEKEVEKAIEKLKLDGYIYDPRRNDRYKVV